MIDFNLIKELSIVEGNVVKIENEIGQVIWNKNVKYDRPIKLGVEKITANTYAGETTYENEQFILLDIYPKTADSIISVTYEGLTKTLTFNGTNAKQVYFGTFNGVADSVATPTSGTLTIEGDCVGVGVGAYNTAKSSLTYCGCITSILAWGEMTKIPASAFCMCKNLELFEIPNGITHIGNYAFKMEPDRTGGADANSTVYTKMDRGTIILPDTVQSLGYNIWTFNVSDDGYIYIDNLVLRSSTPPVLEGTKLADFKAKLKTITVPKGCGETYKTADGWSAYANYIVEVS